MDPVLGAACQWCGAALPAGARYCRNCGRSQPTTQGVPADVTLGTQPMPGWPCPSCGSLLPAGARYCWDCGQPVAAAETEETDQRRKIAGLALEGLGILSAGENLGAHGVPVPGAAAGPQAGAPTVPGVAAGPQTGASSVPSASAGPQAGASNVPGTSAGPQAGMNYQSPNFSNTVTQPGTSGASGGAGGGSGGGTSGGNTSGGSGGGKPSKKKSPSQPSGGQGGSILTVPHLIIFSLVIVLIAGISAVVIAAPNLLPGGKSAASATNTPGPAPTSTPIIASAATVTITPTSQLEENTFTIEAVTGTPNAQQVQARQLSAKTQTHSKTVNATGQGMTAGTHATGTLYIVNLSQNSSINIPAGTAYDNNACDASSCPAIHMVVDQAVSLPPGGANRTIPGHVQEAGTIGNITSIGAFGYVDSGVLSVRPASAFSGGTDPQPYTYVQQSDINNAANSLISANQPNAQQVLQPQVQANERFAETPQCSPNVSANPPAGTQASQVTVSVNFTCTGEVYDYDGALMLAAQQLTTQATNNLGTAFALSGQIKTTLNSATPGNGGTVTLAIMAMGVWAYQFSAAQQSMLASMIAGKTPQMAQQILETQMGVAQVTIQLADASAQVLPTNPEAITIVVQAVPGA